MMHLNVLMNLGEGHRNGGGCRKGVGERQRPTDRDRGKDEKKGRDWGRKEGAKGRRGFEGFLASFSTTDSIRPPLLLSTHTAQDSRVSHQLLTCRIVSPIDLCQLFLLLL